MKNLINLFLLIAISSTTYAQEFTRQDTLRGSITPERAWWDVKYYDLNVEVKPDEKFIEGFNTITYKVIDEAKKMQIDLQKPMKIDKIIQDGKKLSFTSEGDAHFITFRKKQEKGEENKITIYFSGNPQIAKNAPWDGGFTWTKDGNGKDFIATSNQGIGASIWWPNKDHEYDEPDNGATISVTTPKDLMDVSNGRLVGEIDNGDTKTWVWKVTNPINNYGININIGDFIHFGEKYAGEKGMLDMDYYILRENEEKAKEQFKQAPMMIKAFEHWFGPYPFYEDSYKLVEAPYLGMEHQSSVTYGNKFKNGYLGRDLSGTGWGLKFDFIIIHESGHEWFANNITNEDVADMWIHEGFTAYSENLYVDYYFGKKAATDYVIGTRKSIRNDRPIIGTYNVNKSGSGDMYYKGANILHMIRTVINDDEKWRNILRGLNKDFYHSIVTSKQVENYVAEKSGLELDLFWDQYLRTTMIPTFEYTLEDSTIKYRLINIVEDLVMPIKFRFYETEVLDNVGGQWRSITVKKPIDSIAIDRNYFIDVKKL